MGARFRLKASLRIAASLRADTKAVLRAMKNYGLVLADNGSPWYFQGTSDTPLAARDARRAQGDPGARVRGGRHLEPDGERQQRAGEGGSSGCGRGDESSVGR